MHDLGFFQNSTLMFQEVFCFRFLVMSYVVKAPAVNFCVHFSGFIRITGFRFDVCFCNSGVMLLPSMLNKHTT